MAKYVVECKDGGSHWVSTYTHAAYHYVSKTDAEKARQELDDNRGVGRSCSPHTIRQVD